MKKCKSDKLKNVYAGADPGIFIKGGGVSNLPKIILTSKKKQNKTKHTHARQKGKGGEKIIIIRLKQPLDPSPTLQTCTQDPTSDKSPRPPPPPPSGSAHDMSFLPVCSPNDEKVHVCHCYICMWKWWQWTLPTSWIVKNVSHVMRHHWEVGNTLMSFAERS